MNSSNQTDPIVTKYMKSMNEKEKKGYEIAKNHLGMSFQIEKSNGFIEWKKNHLQQIDSLKSL